MVISSFAGFGKILKRASLAIASMPEDLFPHPLDDARPRAWQRKVIRHTKFHSFTLLTDKARNKLIEKVNKRIHLTEKEDFNYLTKVLGMSDHDARFVIERPKIVERYRKKGITIYVD
jgi:hypothetical protein